jgi:hypothetical protein
LLKQLLILVAYSGQFGWFNAMSLSEVWRLARAVLRAPPIQNPNANVNPTSKNTGSKTI